jgi:hypothetical protein
MNDLQQRAGSIEYLQSPVAAIGDIDAVLAVDQDRVRRVELARPRSRLAPGTQPIAVWIGSTTSGSPTKARIWWCASIRRAASAWCSDARPRPDESAHPLEHPKPPLPPVDGMFRQVTDVAWDSDDNTYISDGYINSRIARYDKDSHRVRKRPGI